jgi:hypothetical protein
MHPICETTKGEEEVSREQAVKDLELHIYFLLFGKLI